MFTYSTLGSPEITINLDNYYQDKKTTFETVHAKK